MSTDTPEPEITDAAPSPVEETSYLELYQRALAEQENLRKRMETEKRQFTKFALAGAAESLLPVVDNFYRATEHIPEDQAKSPWITGIMHIQKQLLDTLTEWGVQEIQVAPGAAFNPHQHEAIASETNPDLPDDSVIRVQQRGYMLHERVLRPAQVITNNHHQ